jgi:hypothetical protein
MKCEEARQLMQLNRPGELTPNEQDRLEQHCTHCPACAAKRERVLRADLTFERLRAFTPSPRHPELLTASIMREVRKDDSASRRDETVPWIDAILRWFEVPTVRYASALFVIVAFLGFVGQQFIIMDSVSDLEARLARGPQPQIRLAYAINLASVRKLRESRELEHLLPLQIPTNAGERILVTQQTLLALQDLISSRSRTETGTAGTIAILDSLVRHLQKEGAVSLQLMPEGENR